MTLWIRIDAAAPDDPKFCVMGDALGIDPAHAFGLSCSVWCHMAQHAPEGALLSVPDSQIERWAGWRGAPGRFAVIFRSLFTSRTGNVPGWLRRQGKLITRMQKDRDRKRNSTHSGTNPESTGNRLSPGSSPQSTDFRLNGKSPETTSRWTQNGLFADEGQNNQYVSSHSRTSPAHTTTAEVVDLLLGHHQEPVDGGSACGKVQPESTTSAIRSTEKSALRNGSSKEQDLYVTNGIQSVTDHPSQPPFLDRSPTADHAMTHTNDDEPQGEGGAVAPPGPTRMKYPPEFEQVWDAYPTRDGGNNKMSAFHQWQARRKAGYSAEELLAGTKRYASYIRHKYGETPTEFTMTASRFFGKREEFNEPWTIIAKGGAAPQPASAQNGVPDAAAMRSIIVEHELARWDGNQEAYWARVRSVTPIGLEPERFVELIKRIQPWALKHLTFGPDMVKEIARRMEGM